MTEQLKPIKIYGGSLGFNPFKVSIILRELGLPVEEVLVDLAEIKMPAYEALNPNGRLPTIQDPNTGITLGIRFEYGSAEAHHARQFLHFQMSGQGPYYGQAVWFKRFHPERVQSAVDRYINEIRRVSKVLDGILSKQDWLVGNKLSFADLAFIPWQNAAKKMLSDEGYDESKFPHMAAWLERMNSRPVVRDLVEKQDKVLGERLNTAEAALKKA